MDHKSATFLRCGLLCVGAFCLWCTCWSGIESPGAEARSLSMASSFANSSAPDSWVRNESVTEAEHLLWEFIGISSGRLCPIFSFEETPYYLTAVQVLCSFLLALVLELVGRGCHSGGSSETEYELLHDGEFDEEQTHLMYFTTEEPLDKDKGLCAAEVVDVHSDDEETASWRIRFTDGPKSLRDTERDIRISKADGTFSDAFGNTDTCFAFCHVKHDFEPLTIRIYWWYQGLCLLGAAVGLSLSVASHDNDLTFWGSYNLWTYALVHSGIWCTGAQAAFAAIFPNIVGTFVICNLGYNPRGMRAREAFGNSLVAPSIKSAWVAALLAAGLIALPTITHVLPAFFVYFWLFLPLPCVLLFVVVGGARALQSLVKKKLEGEYVEHAEAERAQKATQLLSQLVLTLIVQSSVSLMVRVYAGEVGAGGYLTPLYNDFMSRTWYTLARCKFETSVQKAQNWMATVDLLLKWT